MQADRRNIFSTHFIVEKQVFLATQFWLYAKQQQRSKNKEKNTAPSSCLLKRNKQSRRGSENESRQSCVCVCESECDEIITYRTCVCVCVYELYMCLYCVIPTTKIIDTKYDANRTSEAHCWALSECYTVHIEHTRFGRVT